MSEVIGKGVIEVSADSSKLNAAIGQARQSLRGLGDDAATTSQKQSASIGRYIKSLETQVAVQGRSTRETELYKLALRGASDEQLRAANSALKLSEGYARGQEIGETLRTGFIAVAAAAATAAAAFAAGTIALINQVGKYQDLSDKIGDSAVNISSLKTASDVTGTSLDTIANASIKLTSALSKTDDESKAAGAAITALGLDFQTFKAQSPVEQLQSVARALQGFADGSEQSAIAVALFGKSGADVLGFLKEYAADGLSAAYITAEQAKAADDYSDASAKLKSQVQQFLQVAAVNLIPVLVQVGDLFKDLAKSEDGTSNASAIVKAAIEGLVVVFQTVATIGSDLYFVVTQVGKGFIAAAAAAQALTNGDFSGIKTIFTEYNKQAEEARSALDRFQAKLGQIGKVRDASGDYDDSGARTLTKPKLDISGLNRDKAPKAGKDTAAQEAKAQLKFDLDEIKKSQEALSNLLSNDGKIIAAQHAANLMSDADYYQQRRELIQSDTAVQEFAIEREIARMQREVLTGKDLIDNNRKIADAQAALAKVRANAATELQVLTINEKASLDSVTRAYIDSEIAARSYLDTIARANAREVAGASKGDRAAGFDAGLSEIEDKFEQKRQDLQRDNRNGKFADRPEDYRRELALIESTQTAEIALYRAKYQSLDQIRGDWSAGTSKALKNYVDESRNSYQQVGNLISDSFKGAEDSLVNFVKTGKLNFSSLVDTIVADIARIAVQQSITGPLAAALGGGSGGGSNWIGSLVGLAGGLFGGGYSGLSTADYSTSGFATGADSNYGNESRRGPRATGGPVSGGSRYEVNERGPELYRENGREYLMPGPAGGTVTPNRGSAEGRSIALTVNQSFASGTSRQTTDQAAVQAAAALRRAQRYM